MRRNRFLLMSCIVVLMGRITFAQCVSNFADKLYCLIPTALHSTPTQFNALNTALGTELSQLPIASPASGLIFEFGKNGILTTTGSYGPVLTERAETIGAHKLFLAFTYQHFGFSSFDGVGLNDVPIVFTDPNNGVTTVTTNRLDLKADQFTTYATFGVSSRIDASIAVPILRISMRLATRGTEFEPSGSFTPTFQQFTPGTASGIGDLVLAVKGTVFKPENSGFRLALGAELRLPTGDDLNFLGSGAVGVKPYIAASYRSRISPHLNVAYQVSGSSILARSDTGSDRRLPDVFSYAVGADMKVTNRLTVASDIIGERVIDAPLVTPVQEVPVDGFGTFPSLINHQKIGSFSMNDLSIGGKVRAIGNMLITANLLVKLDNGGLRAKVVPLIGISYTF